MTFLLKIVYYALGSITGLAAALYFVYDLFNFQPTAGMRRRIFSCVASLVCLGLLYLAYQFGHQLEDFATGLWLVLAAIVAYLLITIVGIFTGKIHWQ